MVVVWYKEDYIKEADKRLGNKDVYKEVSIDVPPLRKIINAVRAKIIERGDLKSDNFDYFILKDPELARFCLIPKIHHLKPPA